MRLADGGLASVDLIDALESVMGSGTFPKGRRFLLEISWSAKCTRLRPVANRPILTLSADLLVRSDHRTRVRLGDMEAYLLTTV